MSDTDNNDVINTKPLDAILKALKENKEEILKTDATFDYYTKQSVKEQKEVHFIDIMVALNWNYGERAKIYYDTLMG